LRIPWFQFMASPRRPAVLLVVSLLVSFTFPMPDPMPLPWAKLPPANAAVVSDPAPVQVGTSFSPNHATYLGLDWKESYRRLEAMHFKVIRLSAYWDQVDVQGYDQLDWLLNESRASGQPVVLSVGMKGLGWPEFYIPRRLQPKTEDGGDVSQDGLLRAAVLDFVQEAVTRYRDNPELVACSFIMSGERIFDIRDPLHPREVAYFNMPAPPGTLPGTGAAFAMSQAAWDLGRHELWYSDGTSGLYVIKIGGGQWPAGL